MCIVSKLKCTTFLYKVGILDNKTQTPLNSGGTPPSRGPFRIFLSGAESFWSRAPGGLYYPRRPKHLFFQRCTQTEGYSKKWCPDTTALDYNFEIQTMPWRF